jgi:hypothetical protein
MKNLRDVIAAIRSMSPKGVIPAAGRVRKSYSWSRPHSARRSCARRLRQAFRGQLRPDAFLTIAEYHKAMANYMAAKVMRRPRRTMMP